MSSAILVKDVINNFEGKKLFHSSTLYKEKLDSINEINYYKILERLVKSGELGRLSKGVYYVPEKSKYGFIKPSETEIISTIIENKSAGYEVGYRLYNKLGLTTQVSMNRVFLCNTISKKQLKISNNIYFYKRNIEFSDENNRVIAILEVLQNFNGIQDLNYNQFYKYCLEFSKTFNEDVFNNVILHVSYKKSTVAFLEDILKEFKVINNLNSMLSNLSNYKIPNWRS
jgi:hypothetical protein